MFHLHKCHDILTGVGTERENERNGRRTKMNVIQIEDDG